jgi:chemotaxis protein MotB
MKDKKGKPIDPFAWMVTFSDLIMLLLTFFVMMLTMKSMDRKDTQEMFRTFVTEKRVGQGMVDEGNDLGLADVGSLVQVRHVTSSAMLEKALGRKAMNFRESFQTYEDERGVAASLDTAHLFDPGTAVLRPDAYKTLDLAVELLKKTDNSALILGHTDNTPIHSTEYASNWELSAFRAIAVMDYLDQKGGIDRRRLAAGGYGDTRPLVPNTSPDNQAKNRRVEIVLRK